MRRIGLWVVVVLLVAGGGYWGSGLYFDKLLRDGLDQSIRQLPQGVAVTYQSAHYSILTSKAAVTGIAVHVPQATGALDGSIARLDLVRPNLNFGDGWNDAVATPAGWKPDRALAVAGDIRLLGLHFAGPRQTIDLDTEHLENLRVYPATLLHPGVPGLAEMINAVQPGQAPSPQDLLKLARLEAWAVLGFGFDRQESVGLKASSHIPATTDQPDQVASVEIAQMTATGMDRGIWQDTAGEEISFIRMPGGAMKVGRVDFAGLDLRSALIRLLDATALSPALFDGVSIKRIEYTDMAVQPSEGMPLTFENLALSDLALVKGEPVSGALQLKGLRLERNKMTQLSQIAFFSQLDLDHLTVGLGFGFSRDTAHDTASIHDAYVKLDELGSADLSADLDNIPLGGKPEMATLVKATLHYRDASLIDRVLRLMAHGGDPEQARATLILVARQLGQSFGPDMASATDAVVSFLQKPGGLTIKAAPPQPLPLLALYTMPTWPRDQVARPLGLSVEANQ